MGKGRRKHSYNYWCVIGAIGLNGTQNQCKQMTEMKAIPLLLNVVICFYVHK